MSESAASGPARGSALERVLRFLPRGNMLSDAEWTRRHHVLLWVLGLCIPLLTTVGLASGWSLPPIVGIDLIVAVVVLAAALVHRRRAASLLVTFGLTSSSMALVVLSNGSIEAHFSFFVIVGFLALYQDWFPFLWNIVFTVVSHGIGSALAPGLIFNHLSGQGDPWLWSLIHGAGVLCACAGVLVFWRFSEDLQEQKIEVDRQLAQSEINKKEFTSDLLLNLARRNQSMFHRQLDIINELEEKERDPDVLADLFRLDHLATRVRRNAESLLVLSGEQTPRIWSAPVALRDVVRAAIAETEDLERITFSVDEGLAVIGNAVADLTHLLAELLENAVRFSPPSSAVALQNRPYHPTPGAHLLIVEDTGVGMPPEALTRANELLAVPQEVDVAASRRLGFHVVSRLAERHGIAVSLTPTPGCGLTAVLVLPPELFPVPTVGVSRSAVPSVLAGMSSPAAERVVPPNPATFAASAALPPEPARDDGRHSWPGAVSSQPSLGGPGSPADPNSPVDTEPAAAETRGAHVLDLDDGGARRHGLIHPIVVPPPRGPGGDGATLDPGDLATRRAHDAHGRHPNGHADGAGKRTLTRRVPQSHLAPELSTPRIPDPVPPPPPSAPIAAPAPDRAVFGPPPLAPDERPVDGAGPLTALSRYQASRRIAHLEIGDLDPGPTGTSTENGAAS